MRQGDWCSGIAALPFVTSRPTRAARELKLKGLTMKKYVVPALFAAAVVTSAPALAADLKPVYKAPPPPVSYNPWDVAIGGAVMTDYNFRGISQSDRGPAVNAYFEGRYNSSKDVQWYAGVSATSVKLATDPAAEVDLYGGARFTFGSWVLDIGGMYYLYPGERAIDGTIITAPPAFNTTFADTDFWEVYGKLTYNFNDNWAFGANVFYAPDWLNTGADGTYGSLTLKYTGVAFPSGWNWYVSGEIGHYWLGTTDLAFTSTGNVIYANLTGTGGVDLPDYTYWNAGIGVTYKALTLDFRYHDTNLTGPECNVLTGDPSAALISPTFVTNTVTVGSSNWCGRAFIGKLSFDTTLSALK